MNLYVMRHGRTCWNEKGIIQGHSNNRLSKTGKEQVREVALAHKNTKFDIIVCSPLARTVQTANIMNKFHNVKIVKDARIVEINQGKFSGRKRNSMSEEERVLQQKRLKENGQETFEEIDARIKNFFDNVKNDYPFENVLVVTHDICAAIIEYFVFDQKVGFDKIRFDNAQMKKFEI